MEMISRASDLVEDSRNTRHRTTKRLNRPRLNVRAYPPPKRKPTAFVAWNISPLMPAIVLAGRVAADNTSTL